MAELFAKRAATVVAIGTALFHLYTAFFGTLLTQKIIHLALICTLAFPTAPFNLLKIPTASWSTICSRCANISTSSSPGVGPA